MHLKEPTLCINYNLFIYPFIETTFLIMKVLKLISENKMWYLLNAIYPYEDRDKYSLRLIYYYIMDCIMLICGKAFPILLTLIKWLHTTVICLICTLLHIHKSPKKT